MDTLTFEVRCRHEQSSLVTILFSLVPLNCEAALNQKRLRNAWFLTKRCFHDNQCVPFILFWFSTIHIIFFRRFKLFTFLSHFKVRNFFFGPGMEQLCVNKSHNGSWCEFFKKRDQAKSTSLKLYFSVPGFRSNKWNLRGSLSKNRPINFA